MKKIIFSISAVTLLSIAAFSIKSYAKDEASSYRIFETKAWNGNGKKADYDIGFDKTIKHSGKQSIYIKSKRDGGDFSTLIQSISAEKYLGKRVKLSAYAKSENANQVSLWMRIDDKKNNVLQFDNMDKRPIKGTNDWKKYDVVLDIPNDSNAIVFGGFLAGKGHAWFDDFKLEVVDKTVASTNMEISAPELEPVRRKEIENANFED